MIKPPKFTKEEQKFWQRHYRIEKADRIPAEWYRFHSADSDCDDEFFYFLSLRLLSLENIYLKDSQITDLGVKYMLNFKNLQSLFLRKNRFLTSESVLYFNQMENLKMLNITGTAITLADLCECLDNQSLREIFIDSDENEDEISAKENILKSRIPNCKVYLNCSNPSDVFDVPNKPIY
ncbi:leucine-rich repeat domain-containing protein [Chryseobacterium formosus]|uniref:Leucine-rich repeat domain-containing protein n=1 Tax=Chryseobacterium formosus TaxID=1537363 RepID=A0ABT3XQ97_9FLAO|nr:hypothetical protein [Chryseobacterium formosus]MCX8524305.1 leucine-rich repeat domain-containing protein [Chryseobacterium formosus]